MNAMNDKSLILDHKAQECGAVLMVPPVEQETPFSEQELKMEFGVHVKEAGVDFSHAIKTYLEVVHGSGANKESECKLMSKIAELCKEEAKIGMNIDLALVLAHDSKIYRKQGCNSLEEWVNSVLGVPMNHSTLHRRMVHGRFSMLFAAKGMIDRIPSQTQCKILSQLPRTHWINAWKSIQSHGKIGKDALDKAIHLYARHNNIPLRGQRIDSVLVEPPEVTPLKLPPPPTSMESTPNTDSKPKDVPSPLLSVLKEHITDYLPAYRHKSLSNKQGTPARRFLSAVKAQIRKCPDPKKVDSIEKLFAVIERTDPSLAAKMNKTARAMFFKEAGRHLR